MIHAGTTQPALRSKPGKGIQSFRAGAPASFSRPTQPAEFKRAMLSRSRHIGEVVAKLHDLRRVLHDPVLDAALLADNAWTNRILDTLIKDLSRFVAQFDQQQRRETLRFHVSSIDERGKLAALLHATQQELSQVKAERDAACDALQRLNGLPRIQPLRSSTPSP